MSDATSTRLDRYTSAIAQAYGMHSAVYERHIKDTLILPRLEPHESLVLLPEPLSVLEWTTHAPLWLPLVTWIPLVMYTWIYLVEHRSNPWTLACFLFAFFIHWPLTEYLLHRFVFHSSVMWAIRYSPRIQGIANVARLLAHTVHHAHPTDRRRIVTPLPMSGLIACAVLPPIFYLLPWDGACAWSTGLVLGYVQYDWIHYYLHFGNPTVDVPRWMGWVRRWLQALQRAHNNHHFSPSGPTESFGVAHTTWDWVFGTQHKKPIV